LRNSDGTGAVAKASGLAFAIQKAIADLTRKGDTMNLLEIARDASSAIRKKAAEMGLPVTICVLDSNGLITLIERTPGAGLLSVKMAQAKAHTSALLGIATTDLMPLSQPGQSLYGVTSALGGEFVAFGGGVPLKDGGKLIGGLGVSGGTIEQDTLLANVGTEALGP
jgi:uncharacterized protein GlcG (DUF336 family)